MAFTTTWDAAYEAIPADANDISEGAQRIRNFKRDTRERMDIDHMWDVADGANQGLHSRVFFGEQIADPTVGTDQGALYIKDASGNSELFYRDEAGTVVQLTIAGVINAEPIDANIAKLNVVQTWTKQQHYTLATLTDSATINWDVDDEPIAKVTLAGNRTLALPSNLQPGTYVLIVIQDGTGSRTLAYAANYEFSNGVVPTLSTGGGAVDILTFVCDGTIMYCVESLNFS